MFCQPVALVSPLLDVLRKVDRADNGAARGFARAHAYEIED